ncbi:hypothetical protein KEJ37_02645 [Candidatus Bathyarchaeota archaeon]|nr:hypothetical protein [Candidatus Bathyarchaeota archaeon]
MYELNFAIDMVEEQLVKGNLRWLANFSEIRKDYTIGDVTFPLYAYGSLQEKGFFLSKIFSALVTPRYKIHLLIYTEQNFDPKLVRKLVLACKGKFGSEDWIFLGLVQKEAFQKATKEAIANTADKNVGIVAYSLASKERVTSENVLGKGLAKQLKLTEARFEAFDLPNYLKSFTITFFLVVLFLVFLTISGIQNIVNPLSLLIAIVVSLLVGHRLYRTRYHTVLSMDGKGFQLWEGKTVKEGKWADFSDVAIYVTPKRETCLRLYSKNGNIDLPLSRTGLSRKETYSIIKRLVKRGVEAE